MRIKIVEITTGPEGNFYCPYTGWCILGPEEVEAPHTQLAWWSSFETECYGFADQECTDAWIRYHMDGGYDTSYLNTRGHIVKFVEDHMVFTQDCILYEVTQKVSGDQYWILLDPNLI